MTPSLSGYRALRGSTAPVTYCATHGTAAPYRAPLKYLRAPAYKWVPPPPAYVGMSSSYVACTSRAAALCCSTSHAADSSALACDRRDLVLCCLHLACCHQLFDASSPLACGRLRSAAFCVRSVRPGPASDQLSPAMRARVLAVPVKHVSLPHVQLSGAKGSGGSDRWQSGGWRVGPFRRVNRGCDG